MNFFRREETVAKTIYDKLIEDYLKLGKQYYNLKDDYSQLGFENVQLKNEIENMKNQIKEKEERLQSVEARARNRYNVWQKTERNDYTKKIEKFKIKQEEMQKEINEYIEQINILTEENNELKRKIDNLDYQLANADLTEFTLMNPSNLDYFYTKREAQDFVNSCHEQLQKGSHAYEELVQLFNNQKNENYNLSQLNNELRASNLVLREKLNTQNVQTIDIHDPLNNCTVNQKETIQAAIDNISYVSFNKKYN